MSAELRQAIDTAVTAYLQRCPPEEMIYPSDLRRAAEIAVFGGAITKKTRRGKPHAAKDLLLARSARGDLPGGVEFTDGERSGVRLRG